MKTYIEFRLAQEGYKDKPKYTEFEIYEKLERGEVKFEIVGTSCFMLDKINSNRVMGAFEKSYKR